MQNIESKSPIVFYYMSELAHAEGFCHLLERRFRQLGHDRKIEFRKWNCYCEEPGRDGDLFAYDGMAMTTLVNRRFLRRLPEIIDISNVFDWVHNGSRVKSNVYGIPFLLCGSFLICRRRDYTPVKNPFALEGGLTTTLRDSILPYLYFDAFADKSEAARQSIEMDEKTFGDIIQSEIDRINAKQHPSKDRKTSTIPA